MKKFFAILAISSMSLLGNAQSGVVTQPYSMIDSNAFVGTTPYGNYNYLNYPTTGGGKDTVWFARNKFLAIRVSASTPVAAIQVTVHKDSSGTINAAIVKLQASNDGINWVTLPDTLTCTNITTNVHTWVLPNPWKLGTTAQLSTSGYAYYPYIYLPYLYYAVRFTGVSTSKADIKAYYIPRK